MTIPKTLHPSDYIDRLYVSRKEDWAELNYIEDCVSL